MGGRRTGQGKEEMKYTPTFLATGLTIGCLVYSMGFVPAIIIILAVVLFGLVLLPLLV